MRFDRFQCILIESAEDLGQSKAQGRVVLDKAEQLVSLDHIKLAGGKCFHAHPVRVSRQRLDEAVNTIGPDGSNMNYFANIIVLKECDLTAQMKVDVSWLTAHCKYDLIRQNPEMFSDQREIVAKARLKVAEEVIHRYQITIAMLSGLIPEYHQQSSWLG
jgi:hypothetical protein